MRRIAGMKAPMHLTQASRCDVRVDLRGGDVGVPEHRLHGTEIGAAVEEMGGERMPEAVRRDAAVERRAPEILLQELPDGLA